MANEEKDMETLKTEKEADIREWTERKIVVSKQWIEEEETQKGRNFIRGGIYMCELGENIGNEQGEVRPVIVISNDLINTTSGNVFIVPLTKNLKKKVKRDGNRQVIRDTNGRVVYLDVPKMQSHYFLRKSKYDFLTHDSAAMTEVSRAVSKIRITTHLGTISDSDLEKISTRLEWVMGIRKSNRKS
ncbi:type II toxin-antitoxin system PemK/MazF family toxin [Metabacillus sp. FJAT-52054]|uniref:Type II toxin-antitoxin system PemK/MazF family toxin n=1 Tax=Metabacillus sediminis TaxID=3117746 RepID=A0ABZ2NNJ7_9BACI